MTVHVLPDIERLVIDWCLDTPAVATSVSNRVYSEVPANPTFPLIRVVRFGGIPPQRLHWLDNASMQFDVFGGSKSTTRLVAATLVANLSAGLVGTHDLGVVTAVEWAGPRWEPDASYAPAKPRYVVEASITFHP